MPDPPPSEAVRPQRPRIDPKSLNANRRRYQVPFDAFAATAARLECPSDHAASALRWLADEIEERGHPLTWDGDEIDVPREPISVDHLRVLLAAEVAEEADRASWKVFKLDGYLREAEEARSASAGHSTVAFEAADEEAKRLRAEHARALKEAKSRTITSLSLLAQRMAERVHASPGKTYMGVPKRDLIPVRREDQAQCGEPGFEPKSFHWNTLRGSLESMHYEGHPVHLEVENRSPREVRIGNLNRTLRRARMYADHERASEIVRKGRRARWS